MAIATPLLGTANCAVLPWSLAIATMLRALIIMIPVSEKVWRRHQAPASPSTGPG